MDDELPKGWHELGEPMAVMAKLVGGIFYIAFNEPVVPKLTEIAYLMERCDRFDSVWMDDRDNSIKFTLNIDGLITRDERVVCGIVFSFISVCFADLFPEYSRMIAEKEELEEEVEVDGDIADYLRGMIK